MATRTLGFVLPTSLSSQPSFDRRGELVRRNIRTFKHDKELENGRKISPKLKRAIEESKFAVVVVSVNYAASPWCLDELVKIMDFENKCSISVMPIFYVVDPCHLRRQSGDVVEQFNKDGSDHSKRDLSLLSVVAMACAEQPIKKRRLYESTPESQPPPPPQPESQSPSTVVSSFPAPVTPSPPSQEEIQTRSRNREEIRRVHDCYKRLKSCIGQRDGGGRSANLEQAYRSLISASKGIYTSAPSCVCEYGYFSGFGYSNCYCNQIGALTLMNVRKEKDETAVENKLV